MSHVIGNEFQHCSGHLGDPGRNWNAESVAPADRPNNIKELLQRNVFATENVAMPVLPALHGKKEPVRDIPHIDEVHNEIKVELNTAA